MKNLLSLLVITYLSGNIVLASDCKFSIEYTDQLDHAEKLSDTQIATWKREKISSNEIEANEICNQICGAPAILSTTLNQEWVHTNPICEWRGGCIDKLVLSLRSSASCLK